MKCTWNIGYGKYVPRYEWVDWHPHDDNYGIRIMFVLYFEKITHFLENITLCCQIMWGDMLQELQGFQIRWQAWEPLCFYALLSTYWRGVQILKTPNFTNVTNPLRIVGNNRLLVYNWINFRITRSVLNEYYLPPQLHIIKSSTLSD